MADNSISPNPIIVKQLNICDVPFEVAVISSKCLTLTSLRTGKVAQFKSRLALDTFIEGLRWHIAHKRAMEAQAAADWTWSFKADRVKAA